MPDDKTVSKTPRLKTLLVRGGLKRSEFAETSEALFLTSGYIYDSAEQAERAFKGEEERFIYSRYANPTVGMLEERLGLLEGARFVRATASGMAAVFAALASQVKAGDRVVASRALFGSCHFIISELLPRFGVQFEFVDGANLDQWRSALATPARWVFVESPSNPALDLIDLPAVCKLAHAAGARVVVDNVFATPVLQKPLAMGADIVVYSTTKHMDGQGRTLGGAILTNDESFLNDELQPFLRHTGPSISPFNAWVVLKGLETLELRVHAQCANALTIAEFLASRADVAGVRYPGLTSHPQHVLAKTMMTGGFGSVVAIDVPGGKAGAFRFVNALQMVDISNNLGDAKSLVTHPATTTHQRLAPEERARLGIGDGLVRLSVGLEDMDDLKDDLDRALRAAAG